LKDPTLLNEYQLRGANIDVEHELIPDSRYLNDGLPGDDESIVRMFVTVNQLQRDLALKLANQSSKILEASIRLTKLRRQVADCQIQWPRAEILKDEAILTLLDSADVANRQDEFKEAVDYLAATAALALPLRDDAFRISVLANVSKTRRRMAFFMKALGDYDAANSLLQIEFRMLESVSSQGALTPEVRFAKALLRSTIGRRDEAIPVLRELTRLAPGEWSRPNDSRDRFYEWIRTPAVDSLLEPNASAAVNSSDLDRRAQAIVESLAQEARKIGFSDPDIPEIAITVSHGVHIACSAKRRLKQLDQAEDIVQRFVAFAERLAAIYPDRAATHIVLSDAYAQVTKNAWQRDDDLEASRNLHKAYAAAQRAAQSDPQSLDAQHLMTRLEAKLRRIRKDTQESAGQ
jgi:tetratricopeptide (TPR) repeat protein